MPESTLRHAQDADHAVNTSRGPANPISRVKSLLGKLTNAAQLSLARPSPQKRSATHQAAAGELASALEVESSALATSNTKKFFPSPQTCHENGDIADVPEAGNMSGPR